MCIKKIIIAVISLGLFYGCQDQFELPKPERSNAQYTENVLLNKSNPEVLTSSFEKDGIYDFLVRLGTFVKQDSEVLLVNEDQLSDIVEKFNDIKGGVSKYKLLPKQNYEFVKANLRKGEKEAIVQLIIRGYTSLNQGDYLLPLMVSVDGKKMLHNVLVSKDIEFVSLEGNPKPMPPNSNCSNRTEPMKMVAYVETNDHDIRNMGQFLLKDSKKPIFDMVVLFAANMNYDARAQRRVLFFNDKLQPIVSDPEKYIRPLQKKGIKVIVDILPNHQGVGYENFQNYEEALDFAKQCKVWADKIGIDGWDIDEEYAEYDKLPSKPRKNNSVLWFMRAMKEVMPDKLLTMYDYSLFIEDSQDEHGKSAKDYVDYTWTDYGVSEQSTIGLPKEKHGRYSVEASRYGLRGIQNAAQQNLASCNGIQMIFNITKSQIVSKSAEYYLSKATQLFYGEETIFVGEYHNAYRN